MHGICGIWGTVAVGIFSFDPAHSVVTQLIGTLAIGETQETLFTTNVRSGLIAAGLKGFVQIMPRRLVTVAIVTAGMLSSIAAEDPVTILFQGEGHAAHRLRVVFHDFGVRKDKVVANAVYLVAIIGTVMTAFYLYTI